MKSFFVVDVETRRILQHGYCPDGDVQHQARDGQEVHEGSIDNSTHFINGVPVTLPTPPPTPEEIAAQDENQFASDTMRLIGKAFFNHENRLRVLEGKPAVTWEQFKAAIRGMA